MIGLHEQLEKAHSLECSPQIVRVEVDLNDDVDAQCRQCLSVLFPLYSVDYWMKTRKEFIKQREEMVLRKREYMNLSIAEASTMTYDSPFEYMFLFAVKCEECGTEVGSFFQTANINGTRWLLNRVIINIDSIFLIRGNQNFTQKIRSEMNKLKPFKLQKKEIDLFRLHCEEKLTEYLLRNSSNPTFPENKTKNMLVEDFLKNYSKLDSILSKVERRGLENIKGADETLYKYLNKASILKKQALEYRSKKP